MKLLSKYQKPLLKLLKQQHYMNKTDRDRVDNIMRLLGMNAKESEIITAFEEMEPFL